MPPFIFAFFAGPFGKIAMYIIGSVIFALASTGIYFGWKHKVQVEATVEFNRKQLEQVNKDNEKFKEELAAIQKAQADVVEMVRKQDEADAKRTDAITDYLNSDEATKGDRPSSKILKETEAALSLNISILPS